MNRIKELAKERGISKIDLSDRSGINYWAIDEYYRDTVDINNITIENLIRLCNTLDCKATDIITDTKRLYELKRLLTVRNIKQLF